MFTCKPTASSNTSLLTSLTSCSVLSCVWIKHVCHSFFTSKCRSSILSAQPKFGQRTVSDRISLLAKLSGNSWSSDNISLSTGHLCPVSLICKKKNRNCWSFLSTSLLKQVPVNFWIIRKPFISKSLLRNLPDCPDANKELTRIQNWPVKLVMINEIET